MGNLKRGWKRERSKKERMKKDKMGKMGERELKKEEMEDGEGGRIHDEEEKAAGKGRR